MQLLQALSPEDQHGRPGERQDHGKKLNTGWVSLLLFLLFTRPFPRDGGMAEDHGAPEAEQLPRVWTRGRREIDSRQRVSGVKSP